MRIVFAGTPETAIPALDVLLKSHHEVVAVLTRPDAPHGRKAVMTASPVARFASDHDLRVIKASSMNEAVYTDLRSANPDLGVVVAFGALLPDEALNIPKHGWINLHFSALPHLRGAAPVQWTLINGDPQAHTSVFQLVKKMDAGPIASVETTELAGNETAADLLSTLAITGATQLLRVANDIELGRQGFSDQVGNPTFAPKLSIQDAHLVPDQNLSELFNRYRGVTPEPGAWILDGDVRVKVHEALMSNEDVEPGEIESRSGRVYFGTSTQALELVKVQPAGKSSMSAADWSRGRRR
jgi:methionyl-tRNA formyltransferase